MKGLLKMDNEVDFKNIKDKYNNLRRQNKEFISLKLKEEGFVVCRSDGKEAFNFLSCGQGAKEYTNNGTIKPYDLSNFQYVYAKRNNFDIYILWNRFCIRRNQNPNIIFCL